MMVGRPVDVISVCRADGSIEPLRMQVEGERKEMVRVDIEQIVARREIPHAGVEARVFLCRGTMGDRGCMFELKYTFRTHCWSVLRRVY